MFQTCYRCYKSQLLVLGQSEESILDRSYMARPHRISNEMCDYGQLVLHAFAVHVLWLTSQRYCMYTCAPRMLLHACYLGPLLALHPSVETESLVCCPAGNPYMHRATNDISDLVSKKHEHKSKQSHSYVLVFTMSKVLFAWKPMQQFLMYIRARTGQ